MYLISLSLDLSAAYCPIQGPFQVSAKNLIFLFLNPYPTYWPLPYKIVSYILTIKY